MWKLPAENDGWSEVIMEHVNHSSIYTLFHTFVLFNKLSFRSRPGTKKSVGFRYRSRTGTIHLFILEMSN